MRIDVHTIVSANSIRYYDYLRANYRALAKRPSRVRFLAYCLDISSAFWLNQKVDLASVTSLPYARGSLGHAIGIEAALRRSDSSAIHVIADADTVIFRQGWDSIIEESLTGLHSYGILGVPYESIGGFSSGVTLLQTYKRIPTTTWMAISPLFDFRDLEVRPDKAKVIEVTTKELSEIYNLPVGFSVLKDVGWQIPDFIYGRGISYFALEQVKPKSCAAGPLANISPYHDEFHWNGLPFVAHQRGSMKHRFRIDPLSCAFYDACDAYLGNPYWSIYPTVVDRVVASMQNVIRSTRRLASTTLRRGNATPP